MKTLSYARIFFASMSILLVLAMAVSVTAASLNDYWTGRADWKFVNKWSENDLGGGDTLLDGLHIEVVGNDWYLFTRKLFSDNKLGTEVRHSTNQGWSWSSPGSGTVIVFG